MAGFPVKRFVGRYGHQPSDYSITAYDAALVAIARAASAGKPVTGAAVRDAAQTAKAGTLRGEVSFDANGDLANRRVRIYRYKSVVAAPQGAA